MSKAAQVYALLTAAHDDGDDAFDAAIDNIAPDERVQVIGGLIGVCFGLAELLAKRWPGWNFQTAITELALAEARKGETEC